MPQLDLFALFDAPALMPAASPPQAVPAGAASGPADLREILTSYASADATWESLAQHGATDADLAKEIASLYCVPIDGQSKAGIDFAALVPTVRTMFAIPAQKVDASTLDAAQIIAAVKAEASLAALRARDGKAGDT